MTFGSSVLLSPLRQVATFFIQRSAGIACRAAKHAPFHCVGIRKKYESHQELVNLKSKWKNNKVLKRGNILCTAFTSWLLCKLFDVNRTVKCTFFLKKCTMQSTLLYFLTTLITWITLNKALLNQVGLMSADEVLCNLFLNHVARYCNKMFCQKTKNDYLCTWIMIGEDTGSFDKFVNDQMYVSLKKVLLTSSTSVTTRHNWRELR